MSIILNHVGLGQSKRETISSKIPISTLPSPFGELGSDISDHELRETAYEIFVGACKTSGAKPLTYIPQSEKLEKSMSSLSFSSSSSGSASLQRSLTATAASKMKKALGLKASKKSPQKENSPSKSKKPMTIGDLVRDQMRISEQMDSRIRRALLRIAAGHLGKRVESIVLPLELLQQLKPSDFSDTQEYEVWQMRNLKILEAGLLAHPHLPIQKSDISCYRLRQIIREASTNPIETGRNSEQMQILRTAVTSLAYRSIDGDVTEVSHWVDGFPLNLCLYQKLLETCFDETSIIEEIDEVLDLIKKTWGVLGMNQMLHNLCFTWVLFDRYVSTGQIENELLIAADTQLQEVSKEAKEAKDSIYSKTLSLTLSSILGWAEKRLLAYHDTFDHSNIDSMVSIVSLGISAAKILVEDISTEYRRKRKEIVDVARTTIDTYIRSSIRTAFAQKMEKADSNRRPSKSNPNPSPFLVILAKDIEELANKEKNLFSPILKKWHPLAAGVAVATLHACYGNELKQFILSVVELTPDSVQVLKAADKLEKDLVQIAVEDAVDSEDGGKAIIREMPPYEAEIAISNLAKKWIKIRVDRLKDCVDKNLQQEVWNPKANEEQFAPSSVAIIQMMDEMFDSFFHLPIPMHQTLLPELMAGGDRCIQHYISKAKYGCGTKATFLPTIPALTRCTTESKLQGVWKKKERPQNSLRRSQVGSLDGNKTFTLPQLCVRLNTLQHLRFELEALEKRIVTYYRNSASSHGDVSNMLGNKFEHAMSDCQEGIQQLCEVIAYKLVFHELSHILWDSLYVGDPSSSRIEPLRKELDSNLEMISSTLHERVRNRVITATMKATFDAFMLVLLCGGPSRAFARQDSMIIEDDFNILRALFLADGDGLPEEVVDKATIQARNVLPLFKAESNNLIERFKKVMTEKYGPKSKFPLPPSSTQWNPNDPNTILRVLCYRNDETASRFLKKTYNLPKKL